MTPRNLIVKCGTNSGTKLNPKNELEYCREREIEVVWLFEVSDSEPAIRNLESPLPVPEDFTLQLDNVGFRYGEDEPFSLEDAKTSASRLSTDERWRWSGLRGPARARWRA
jgi:hypothetical protein